MGRPARTLRRITGQVFPLVDGLLAVPARGHEVHVRTGFELIGRLRAADLTAAEVGARVPAVSPA